MRLTQPAIYLDNNATTQLDDRVLEAMLPYFKCHFGNPASGSHCFGSEARRAVNGHRAIIAQAINAESPQEIIFTSGATESINLALKGIAREGGKDHVVVARTEHNAVLDSCKSLQKTGVSITYLEVGVDGLIDTKRIADAVTPGTYLVSIMTANNEIGVVQDIKEIGALCRNRGILFHTDATQAIGKIPFDVREMQIDLASFTAHKIYGPKGVGALYVNRRSLDGKTRLIAQIDGGGHEMGYRSGTLNVPGIVGLATALELCKREMNTESERIRRLRDRLYSLVTQNLDGVCRNGHPSKCLPGTLNLSFVSVDSDSLLLELPEIALSARSACTSAKVAPSHVLKALGLNDDMANASVRFGIGRFNTEEEVDYVAVRCVKAVQRLRSLTPRHAPNYHSQQLLPSSELSMAVIDSGLVGEV